MPAEITALVFDWGDTLMKVFPQFDGAMVDWPRVEAVEGVKETLTVLKGRFRLLAATNAVNSSAAQVAAAFSRAGMDGIIDQVYTFHELGSRKPAPAFFSRLVQIEGQLPGSMVMIGDEYAADISGACQSGLHTIWLNPGGAAAPGLLPLQSAEIRSFAGLPAALERLDLPGVQTCLAWLEQEGTAANLLAHVQAVAALSYRMALWLDEAGKVVDPLLAHRGGLLHDLAKLAPHPKDTAELDHGEHAAQMLLARGQPALAEIARSHLLHLLMDPRRRPVTWEEKLVYLADKLVEGGRVVVLEERLNALRLRYPGWAERMDATTPALFALQEEVCGAMNIPVGQLVPRLKQAMHDG